MSHCQEFIPFGGGQVSLRVPAAAFVCLQFSWAVAVDGAVVPLNMQIHACGEPVQWTRAHTFNL